MRATIEELSELIRRAECIVIFTGAGISTASGIPDFRGPGGIWSRRKPVYYQDFMRSEAARIEHWDYKLEGWEQFRNARPNAVHNAIVRLETAGKLNAVITQNIDGLHQAAGTSPNCLIELHGTNAEIECQTCKQRIPPGPVFEDFRQTRIPPRCAICSGFLKPATISFGQSLDPRTLERAERAVTSCDLLIAMGSTLTVYPAAEFPLVAAERGVPYVVINRGKTEHDGLPQVTLRIEGEVTRIFPAAADPTQTRPSSDSLVSTKKPQSRRPT